MASTRKGYCTCNMSMTLEELKQALANQLDEVGILEALHITSEELVERFEDKIEQYYPKLVKELD